MPIAFWGNAMSPTYLVWFWCCTLTAGQIGGEEWKYDVVLLKTGDSFPITLTFKTAGDVTVDVKVVDKVDGAMTHEGMAN